MVPQLEQETMQCFHSLHFSEDVIVSRLEGYVEELTELGQARTGFDQPVCEVSAGSSQFHVSLKGRAMCSPMQHSQQACSHSSPAWAAHGLLTAD